MMRPSRLRITPLHCIGLGIGVLFAVLTSINDLSTSPEIEPKVYKRNHIFKLDKNGDYDIGKWINEDEKSSEKQPYKFDINAFGKVVNPHPYNYTIDPEGACWEKRLFLVVYVHTTADHLDRRNQIRETWGNRTQYMDTKIKVFFMMGQPGTKEAQKAILEEADKFKDIVQENYADAYQNQSLKAVGAMRWVSTRCKQAKFVLKTDDDVFVNMFTVIKHLQDLNEFNISNYQLLMCPVSYNMHVVRKGKWAIPRSVIQDEYYPQYCSGIGYIMSMDVVDAIYQISAFVPFFWVDDVYITGMVPKVMNLTHVDIGKLVMGRTEIEWLLSGQDWYKYMFSHLSEVAFFREMWKKLVSRESLEYIPDISPIEAGHIATDYGPKKPPKGWGRKKAAAKKGRKKVIKKKH